MTATDTQQDRVQHECDHSWCQARRCTCLAGYTQPHSVGEHDRHRHREVDEEHDRGRRHPA